MNILNSSGLVVRVDVATPTTVGGTPFYAQGPISDYKVAPSLKGAVSNQNGIGAFDLGNSVSGIRGSISAFVTLGAQGGTQIIGYLTDGTSNQIILGVDPLNRPFLTITDNAAVTVASVVPAIAAIPAGQPLVIKMSWDSTQAIDGNRFALLLSGLDPVPLANWTVNPTTSWKSFQPTTVVLGTGVGSGVNFAGDVTFFQVSNQTLTGSTTTAPLTQSWTYNVTMSDSVGSTTG